MDRLSTLKLFTRAVELASISGAGRTYGISTTTASRRLQELEESMQARLLDRTTRSVTPTDAGQALYERVSPLIIGIETALQEASEVGEQPAGTLRVLARRSFAMLHVAPALPAFLQRHPGITVDLELTERVEIAPGDGIDVVIRLGAPAEKSLTSHRLASGERVLCASPHYLARHGSPDRVEDLARHACLTYRREREPAAWIAEIAGDGPAPASALAPTSAPARAPARLEIAVSGPLRATNGEVLREAALAGCGLVLLPTWMVARDLAQGSLVRCLEGVRAWPAGFNSEIVAVHRRTARLPTKIAVFMEHLLTLDPEGALAR